MAGPKAKHAPRPATPVMVYVPSHFVHLVEALAKRDGCRPADVWRTVVGAGMAAVLAAKVDDHGPVEADLPLHEPAPAAQRTTGAGRENTTSVAGDPPAR